MKTETPSATTKSLSKVLVPFILRPGMYVGPQGDRTNSEWIADAIVEGLSFVLNTNK